MGVVTFNRYKNLGDEIIYLGTEEANLPESGYPLLPGCELNLKSKPNEKLPNLFAVSKLGSGVRVLKEEYKLEAE